MASFEQQLTQVAAINLHFAQAEIEAEPDYPSIVRALQHVIQAERSLGMLADELRPHDCVQDDVS